MGPFLKWPKLPYHVGIFSWSIYMHDVMNYYRIPFNMTCIFEKVKGAIKSFCDIVIYGINRYLQSPLLDSKPHYRRSFIYFYCPKALDNKHSRCKGTCWCIHETYVSTHNSEIKILRLTLCIIRCECLDQKNVVA